MNEGGRTGVLTVAWLWVGVPFTYGVYALVTKVIPLFTS